MFVELKGLRRDGYTIIFISHKLNEVKELCDRVTVLRAGATIGTKNLDDVSESEIAKMMVGRDIIVKIDKKEPKIGGTIVEAKNLVKYSHTGKKVLDDVSLNLKSGVILGVAGVEGNGQRELSEILAGMERNYEGNVCIKRKNIRTMSIRDIRDLGVAHISEDRMTYGIVSDGSISENIISDRYYKPEFQKGFLIDYKKVNELTDELINDFNVRCENRDQPIRMLSGGNMQKVVAAREFSSDASFIIANQPTRGIDVGASDFLRRKLIYLRDEGAAVLLISADLNEVMEVSDSLIVMHKGKIVAYFESVKNLTEDEIGEYMLGIKTMSNEDIWRVADEN